MIPKKLTSEDTREVMSIVEKTMIKTTVPMIAYAYKKRLEKNKMKKSILSKEDRIMVLQGAISRDIVPILTQGESSEASIRVCAELLNMKIETYAHDFIQEDFEEVFEPILKDIYPFKNARIFLITLNKTRFLKIMHKERLYMSSDTDIKRISCLLYCKKGENEVFAFQSTIAVSPIGPTKEMLFPIFNVSEETMKEINILKEEKVDVFEDRRYFKTIPNLEKIEDIEPVRFVIPRFVLNNSHKEEEKEFFGFEHMISTVLSETSRYEAQDDGHKEFIKVLTLAVKDQDDFIKILRKFENDLELMKILYDSI